MQKLVLRSFKGVIQGLDLVQFLFKILFLICRNPAGQDKIVIVTGRIAPDSKINRLFGQPRINLLAHRFFLFPKRFKPVVHTLDTVYLNIPFAAERLNARFRAADQFRQARPFKIKA